MGMEKSVINGQEVSLANIGFQPAQQKHNSRQPSAYLINMVLPVQLPVNNKAQKSNMGYGGNRLCMTLSTNCTLCLSHAKMVFLLATSSV